MAFAVKLHILPVDRSESDFHSIDAAQASPYGNLWSAQPGMTLA